ncbi:diguanylate cyclase domain-containing protein, partial [Stella sp.]|uniref:diguanylate cyclase domain-containing protein n=1 Tax=Stella sp. TaxID=2912054 RepID=UPI0035AFE838
MPDGRGATAGREGGTDDRPSRGLLALQTEILEAVATGTPLQEVAALLCRRAEAMAPSAICTIVGIDEHGRLDPIAAPSLPDAYSEAIAGVPVGPRSGSCGTAAFLGRPVEVRDIETDPLWTDYAAIGLAIGLRACWSSPIFARDGRVVATFAFYYRTRRGPGVIERRIVDTCVHLCAIALAHAEAQRRNYALAHFDQLTGLPNRRRFNAVLDARLAAADPSFGLLLVDIDHLKAINDTMGHVVGDAVIQEVARRIRDAAPDALAFRLAGDEFALLVEPCPDHAALAAVSTAVLAAARAPFACEGGVLVPQVTAGGVVRGVDGTEAETLSQNADFALHHAKEV